MNVSAVQHFREQLRSNQLVVGLWVTLEAPAVSDIAAGLGFDWVAIDSDYLPLDGTDIGEHVRAAQRSDTAVLISVAGLSLGCIRRALAIGADGIIIRQIEKGSGLQTAVKQVLDYTRATPGVAAAPLVMVVAGSSIHVQDFGDLLEVDGVDAFLLENSSGPVASIGLLENFPGSGRPVGIIVEDQEMLPICRENGFRLIALGVDRAIIGAGIRDALGHAGGLSQ